MSIPDDCGPCCVELSSLSVQAVKTVIVIQQHRTAASVMRIFFIIDSY